MKNIVKKPVCVTSLTHTPLFDTYSHPLASLDTNFSCLTDTPTDNTPQSSRPPTFDPATILNNNNSEEAIHNVNNNNTSSTTNNNMFENEANNNNNTGSVTQSTEVMLAGVSDNKNCLQSLITEEDSANGNVPLPV